MAASGNPFCTEVLDASVEFIHQPFHKPLQLSSGLITEITEARASVRVRVSGREATGHGSIYLSDLWAWPDAGLSHAVRDGVLRRLCDSIARSLAGLCGSESAHPLELGLRLHHELCHNPRPIENYNVPILARAMCGSPFDAALHDAVGQALQCSAFDLYGEEVTIPHADGYFAQSSAVRAIQSLTKMPPVSELDGWLVVGAKDSVAEDLKPWIQERGYHCFKLKLLAQDVGDDVARTVEVFRGVQGLGVKHPRLSVDSNEANPDAASVLDYLQRLRVEDEAAFTSLEYLEQPTGRDITRYVFDWKEVASLKPVLLDEGLTSLDLLPEAIRQGWNGLALKTCKGHSFTLTAAAWARENGLLLTMQDLTNPGLAAIHSALFAARVPTLNGIELNSPQYTPAANVHWLPRLQELFEPRHGVHKIPEGTFTGLGSQL